ncbi:hypothetical protein MJK72_07870 [Klebsiella pneumoniae]|nr:hypothetical protein MJK72_07870 [Klebsiella pneumoniae]
MTIHEADGSRDTFTVPYATLPGLNVRAGAVYYDDLSLGYLDEDRIAGRPGFSEAALRVRLCVAISAAIPALTRRQIITRRWSAAPSAYLLGRAGGRSFPFCGEGQGTRLAGGATAGGCPHQNRLHPIRECALLSMSHSNDGNYRSDRDAAWEPDRVPQRDWREVTHYSATLSQQAGGGD